MKIATWNVNSIRVRLSMVIEWLKLNNIDTLLMQEIKCQEHQFPYEEFENAGYNCFVHGQKALNGVAIVTKFKSQLHKIDLPLYEYGDIYKEARYIEIFTELNGLEYRISSGYFPNGSPLSGYEGIDTESERFHYKLDFFRRFIDYAKQEQVKNSHQIFIHGGDFNIMHNDIDVYNPKNWRGKIAFTDIERGMINEIHSIGFIDTFRHKNPDLQEYTWWDYRSRGFEKNYGLRIDYIYIHNTYKNLIKHSYIDRSVRALQKPSDHAPSILLVE